MGTHTHSAVARTAALLLFVTTLGSGVVAAEAAEGHVEATALDCRYDASTGTMLPVATVQRLESASSSDNRVSTVMALMDGDLLVDQLSAGEVNSDGSVTQSGLVMIAPGAQTDVTPWGGTFGDTSRAGAPALVPDHTYTVRVRNYEFASGEQTLRYFECITTPSDEVDTDGDGLTDAEEKALETDRLDTDTDDDFLADGAEVEQGLDPLDRDSDDGAVRDDREISKGSDPTSDADDIPLPYDTFWRDLVDMAAGDYRVAKKKGDATRGYYHQVLNLVCSAAGVSEARPAGATAMKYCPAMAEAVGAGYGEWAGDFPYEVFRSFLPTVDDAEISATGKKAKRLAHALCAMATTFLSPAAGFACERRLDDIGFSIAGSVHAAHHLYPNFVRHAESIIGSADGGTRLQTGILTQNMTVMRKQHQLLFSKAVKPGFDSVYEVSGVYKWIARKFVPFAASCERENAIREAMRNVLGTKRGNKVFLSTDATGKSDIVTTYRCRAWMKAAHLL